MKKFVLWVLLFLGVLTASAQAPPSAPQQIQVELVPGDIHDITFEVGRGWIEFTAKGRDYIYSPDFQQVGSYEFALSEWRRADRITLSIYPPGPDTTTIRVLGVRLHLPSLLP